MTVAKRKKQYFDNEYKRTVWRNNESGYGSPLSSGGRFARYRSALHSSTLSAILYVPLESNPFQGQAFVRVYSHPALELFDAAHSDPRAKSGLQLPVNLLHLLPVWRDHTNLASPHSASAQHEQLTHVLQNLANLQLMSAEPFMSL